MDGSQETGELRRAGAPVRQHHPPSELREQLRQDRITSEGESNRRSSGLEDSTAEARTKTHTNLKIWSRAPEFYSGGGAPIRARITHRGPARSDLYVQYGRQGRESAEAARGPPGNPQRRGALQIRMGTASRPDGARLGRGGGGVRRGGGERGKGLKMVPDSQGLRKQIPGRGADGGRKEIWLGRMPASRHRYLPRLAP